jgi:hypothetical protein
MTPRATHVYARMSANNFLSVDANSRRKNKQTLNWLQDKARI